MANTLLGVECATVQELDSLLHFLESMGYCWHGGKNPTQWKPEYKHRYCICIWSDKDIAHDKIGNDPNNLTFKQYQSALKSVGIDMHLLEDPVVEVTLKQVSEAMNIPINKLRIKE